MIDRELHLFGRLVLRLRDAAEWGSESDLVVKSMTVAKAVAQLAALREETGEQESPWRLSKRRALEKAVEAVIPVGLLVWGSWLKGATQAKLDPILSIQGVPVPVVAALGPPRLPSKAEKKAQNTLDLSLEARRRAVGC
jgi:hypothetical protein